MNKQGFEQAARRIRRTALPATAAALAIAGCGGTAKKPNTNANKAPTPPNSTNTLSTNQPKVKITNHNPIPKNRLGYDVSYPNGHNLPKGGSFAIIGLNGINAATFNKDYKYQLIWGSKFRQNASATNPGEAIYVHTADPYPNQVNDWPKKGSTPYGNCNGTNTTACAYQYGENLAKRDYGYESRKIGVILGGVWLDVEGTEDGYSWQKDKSHNAAVLEGMTAAFKASPTASSVGIYSGEVDWSRTIGSTPKGSDLEGLPDWILGATDAETAASECLTSPAFTGKIIMAQIAGKELDRDVICP